MRGAVEVVVEFRAGARFAPLLDRVSQVATLESLGGHVWRATFRLDAEHRGFGSLAALIEAVGGKRSSKILVNGYPEMTIVVLSMAHCAGPFAYSVGRCGFDFEYAVPARCRACPLFDNEQAEAMIADSYARERP